MKAFILKTIKLIIVALGFAFPKVCKADNPAFVRETILSKKYIGAAGPESETVVADRMVKVMFDGQGRLLVPVSDSTVLSWQKDRREWTGTTASGANVTAFGAYYGKLLRLTVRVVNGDSKSSESYYLAEDITSNAAR